MRALSQSELFKIAKFYFSHAGKTGHVNMSGLLYIIAINVWRLHGGSKTLYVKVGLTLVLMVGLILVPKLFSAF